MFKPSLTPLAVALVPLACIGFSSTAAAQTSSSQPAAYNQLNPVTVTAHRLSQPLNHTVAATTLITRADIERLQVASLADLLHTQAGVEISRTGGSLTQTSVFMRGTNSNHTLVLVNGQKINDPTSGIASLQFIDLNTVERIEIVRGPQSSAWGADALGGVINIITRSATTEGFSGQISQSYASQQTWHTAASLAGANATTGFNASFSLEQSDGFNATTADTSGEKDAYERSAFNAGVFHQINNQHQVNFNLNHNQGENDYDDCWDAMGNSSNTCTQEFNLTAAQLGWQAKLNPNWLMQLNLQTALEEREEFREGQANGELKTQRDSLRLDHQLTGSNYTATVGADWNQEQLSKVTGFTQDERYSWGVFAQGQQQLTQQLVVNGGVRFDKDEYFGNQTTANLALAWQFSPVYQTGISVAQGYRAPNLADLYAMNWGGNPDLRAEESINYETWVAFDNQQGARSRISLFQNTIDDLITSDSNLVKQNIDEARIRGVELASSYHLAQWVLGLNLTWQDPENRATGKQLLRRAKRHGRLDVDYLGRNWSLGSSLVAQAQRYDWDGPSLPGYAQWNLRASWQLASAWQLSAKLDNLLDKHYQLASGYNTQGRYSEVKVAFNF